VNLTPVTGGTYIGYPVPPGTYYLRVASYLTPQGIAQPGSLAFYNFILNHYISPENYTFSVDNQNDVSSLEGWKLKNANTDMADCDISQCFVRFTSDGAGEKTQLKASVDVSATKFKPNDLFVIQMAGQNYVGEPDLLFKYMLINASGAKQVFTLRHTSSASPNDLAEYTFTQGFTPVRAVIKIINKDKDLGDSVELTGVVALTYRLGGTTRALAELTSSGVWNVPAQPEAAPLPLPQP
jgi:hypothetical protein